MNESKHWQREVSVRLGDVSNQYFRALLGLLLIQIALPRILPLPGLSEHWLVIFVGGGVPGIIAVLTGGVVILAYAVALLPRVGWSAWRWGALAAGVAVGARVGAVLAVSALTEQAPTRYPWGDVLAPWPSLVVALALAGLVYGGLTAAVVTLARRATQLPH